MRSRRSWVASTRPPSSIEPRLSPWRLPLATASPSSANGYSASRDSGCSSKALAATSAATHEAAEPPMPEPSAMPLCSTSSKPNGSASDCRSDNSAVPAVLRSGSSGRPSTQPRIAAMRTTGSSMRRTSARSPAPATLWPSRSKPTPTLPTLAGAKARADSGRWARCGAAMADSSSREFMRAPPATRQCAAGRRTRRRRSPRDRRRGLARSADYRSSGAC